MRRVFIFLFFFSSSPTLQAQDAWQRESVYEIKAVRDWTLLGLSALAVTTPYALSHQLITPRCPCDPATVNAFDRPAIGHHSDLALHLSDALIATALVTPAALDFALLGWSEPLLEDALVYGQSLLLSGTLVGWTKHLVQRPLPRTYEGDPDLLNKPAGYRSFYSGHVSTTVAALSTASLTYALRKGETSVWPWVLTAATGVAMGFLRFQAGSHFPSDILVGGAMGAIVGTAVPWFHEKAPGMSLFILPSEEGPRLALNGRF